MTAVLPVGAVGPTPTLVPVSAPSYSPEDLMAETYRALWELGLIPDGSKVDPYAAVATCADLLRAFGITPASAA